jgi:endonuclease YncB( thermonuclease family)
MAKTTNLRGQIMKILYWLLALVIASSLAAALPDEATGLVTYVADGDTFTVEGLGDVRLADINCPELDATGGPEAKEFTRSSLLNRQVYLDIDDKTEKDRYGRYVCVAYLPGPEGAAGQRNEFSVN